MFYQNVFGRKMDNIMYSKWLIKCIEHFEKMNLKPWFYLNLSI